MNSRSRLGWLVGLAAIVIAGATGAAAADMGRCQTSAVPGPLVLPDGSVHEAHSVRVCLSREYSPVAGLHEVSIDGRPIGMFLGREYALESHQDHEPFLLLVRDGTGRLALRGYATRGSIHDLAPALSADGVFSVSARWQLLAKI